MVEIKEFLKQFKWLFLVLGIVFLIWLFVVIGRKEEVAVVYERTNQECDTKERVFDYADKLTDSEEESLRMLIAEREKQIGCDIILVTLDEELSKSTMDYADDFYDEHKFGYDEPWGDGVVYVDNWYDGYVWLSTSGKAENRYSDSMIDRLIDNVTSITNDDPYMAYERYVNMVYEQMSGKRSNSFSMPLSMVLLLSVILTVIYTVTGIINRKTKRTTTITEYVPAGAPEFGTCRDTFLRSHTTRRHIERSSGGSGGGGHHMSSGGHSHGGGGGRH